MLGVHVFVRGDGAKPNWKSAGAQFHTRFHQQLAFSKGEKRGPLKLLSFCAEPCYPSLTKTHPFFPLNAQTAEWANDCMHSLQPRANWWCMVRATRCIYATPSVSQGLIVAKNTNEPRLRPRFNHTNTRIRSVGGKVNRVQFMWKCRANWNGLDAKRAVANSLSALSLLKGWCVEKFMATSCPLITFLEARIGGAFL